MRYVVKSQLLLEHSIRCHFALNQLRRALDELARAAGHHYVLLRAVKLLLQYSNGLRFPLLLIVFRCIIFVTYFGLLRLQLLTHLKLAIVE